MTIFLKRIDMAINNKQFGNNLTNWKQYIQIRASEKANLQLVKCGVSQGPILGPALFLSYSCNDNFLSPIPVFDC